MKENPLQNQVKEITDKLEQGIKELFKSEKYLAYLNTMSKFHNYSYNNILLIAMQKPDATLIAGYNAWKNVHGRQVMKGEKAIKILAPAPYKIVTEKEKIDPKTGKQELDSNGKPIVEKVEVKIPAYKIVSVFDISQTEGKEIPTIGVNELTGEVDNYKIFFEALTKSCPIPVSFEGIQSGANGYFSPAERKIAIKEGMSQIQTVKTLIHEMAHQKLHSGQERVIQSRSSKEVEAESVAYTICQHYGIDTSDYSFAYIAGWSAGKDVPELKESLGIIRKSASEMITEIDKNILEISREMNTKETGLSNEIKNNNKTVLDKRPSILDSLHKKQEQIKSILPERQSSGKNDREVR